MSDHEARGEQLLNLSTRAVAVEHCNAPVRKDETREDAMRSIDDATDELEGELSR